MCSLSKTASSSSSDDDGGLRRGPWTVEEDNLLIHYISSHGEGRWNLLAKRSGLKRTGKSCRLRWLNYLKPDVKRGNLSPEEQLLILELHSKWGNRWSKIAQHLPGRTDNEIKNYWRTRVQKQARHLKIDSNSTQFQELIRRVWMPRLLQKIQGQSAFWDSSHPNLADANQVLCNSLVVTAPPVTYAPLCVSKGETSHDLNNHKMYSTTMEYSSTSSPSMSPSGSESTNISNVAARISERSDQIPFQDMESHYYCSQSHTESYNVDNSSYDMETFSLGPFAVMGGSKDPAPDIYNGNLSNWFGEELAYGLWNMDELWQLREGDT